MLLPVLAGPEIQKRFLSTSKFEQDSSAQSRLGTWKAAWRMALDNPVVGVGVRNACLFTNQYGSDFEGAIHSTYLQTAADMGLVGLGLYLFALGSGWNSLRRARRAVAGREDAEALRVRHIAAGVECSLLTFCVGCCFLSLDVFELPYLLLLLAAQLAALVVGKPGINASPELATVTVAA